MDSDKLVLILEKLEKLDQIEADILALRSDNKSIHRKLDNMQNDITSITKKVKTIEVAVLEHEEALAK